MDRDNEYFELNESNGYSEDMFSLDQFQEEAVQNIKHIIHDLQEHQTELEMQNEELQRTKLELEKTKDKYLDLFDFAPVGYFTIDKNGRILEVNLTGANLLGTEKNSLIKSCFSRYVADDYQDVFYYHRKQLFESKTPKTCELKLKKDGNEFDVLMESLAVQDEEGNYSQFRTAITDITKRKQNEKKLQEYREHLEEIVKERTAELEKTNEQLRREIEGRRKREEEIRNYQKRLSCLTCKLSRTEERERRRMAKQLHDDIGQTLALSKMMLGELQESVSSGNIEKVRDIRELTQQALQNTRFLTFELSPPIIYELGLVPAIEWLIENIQESTDISFELEGDGSLQKIDEDISVILFKSVRELLVNIIRHSQADKARVSIEKSDNNVKVKVEDNGVGAGFSKIDSYLDENGGIGLFNIREQLNNINGEFKFESEHGKGTRITLIAPLNPENQKAGKPESQKAGNSRLEITEKQRAKG